MSLGGAALALGALAVVGDSRDARLAWLVLAADLVHVTAAAVWLGGLVGLRAQDAGGGAGGLGPGDAALDDGDRRPFWARRRATAQPMTPAPTTTTSGATRGGGLLAGGPWAQCNARAGQLHV